MGWVWETPGEDGIHVGYDYERKIHAHIREAGASGSGAWIVEITLPDGKEVRPQVYPRSFEAARKLVENEEMYRRRTGHGLPEEGALRIDMRGTPKGETRRWNIEPLMDPDFTLSSGAHIRGGGTREPGRRRIRIRFQITYCADGFWSSSGGDDSPYKDSEICLHGIERFGGHYSEQHPDPCLWRVDMSRGRTRLRAYYCDADFPASLRALIHEADS